MGMLKDDSLKGKRILITGGGTGLGKAMTDYFLELGASCLISSRKDDVIQHTARELSNKHQGKCLAIAGDVRNYEDVERVVAYGYEQLGGNSSPFAMLS